MLLQKNTLAMFPLVPTCLKKKEGLQDCVLFLCLKWVVANQVATEAKGAGPRLVLYVPDGLKSHFWFRVCGFLGVHQII